jgi:hypothetical protein
MTFKIYWPWNNLGCLGFRIGRVYFDLYRTWSGFPIAFFMNTGKAKYRWSWAKGFRLTDN